MSVKRDAAERTAILQRLARIEGQVRGLRLMVENDRQTLEQIQQANAVIAALREVALMSISHEIKGQLADMAGATGDVQGIIELLRSAYRLT